MIIMGLTSEERTKLEELLKKAHEEGLGVEIRIILAGLPRFEWGANLLAFKFILRKVLAQPQITYEELIEYMRSNGLASQKATVKNYGYVYNETGIFVKDNENKVSLTPIGKSIAEAFDDNDEIRPLEMVILRGLQIQGAGFSLLHILSRSANGIFREQLKEKMMELYGASGAYFVGYYTGLYKNLGLIRKETVNGKAKYLPMYPVTWGNPEYMRVEGGEDDSDNENR
jgi:hypothetical protein